MVDEWSLMINALSNPLIGSLAEVICLCLGKSTLDSASGSSALIARLSFFFFGQPALCGSVRLGLVNCSGCIILTLVCLLDSVADLHLLNHYSLDFLSFVSSTTLFIGQFLMKSASIDLTITVSSYCLWTILLLNCLDHSLPI